MTATTSTSVPTPKHSTLRGRLWINLCFVNRVLFVDPLETQAAAFVNGKLPASAPTAPGNPLKRLQTWLAAPPQPGRQSRFTDGTFRAIYMGDKIQTSQAEVAFHLAREAANSDFILPGTFWEYAVAGFNLAGSVLDVRQYPALHQVGPIPACYAAPNAVGAQALTNGELGLRYDSVRNPNAGCVAVFRASLVIGAQPIGPLILRWDGTNIV